MSEHFIRYVCIVLTNSGQVVMDHNGRARLFDTNTDAAKVADVLFPRGRVEFCEVKLIGEDHA